MGARSQRRARSGCCSADHLEGRYLLSVSAAEYDAIRARYANFALPADMTQVNIIEVTADQLNATSLRNAITTAVYGTPPDLIVLRTTQTQNRIIYGTSTDRPYFPALGSYYGSISIVALGPSSLTLDAAGLSPVMRIGSSAGDPTAPVNLGNLVLTGGKGNYGGGVEKWGHGRLCMTDVTLTGNEASNGGGAYLVGNSVLTNVIVSSNRATLGGGGLCVLAGDIRLTNTTISRNGAIGDGGGMYLNGVATANNTLIAGNTSVSGSDVYGTTQYPAYMQGKNNLLGNGANQTGLVNGVDGNIVGTPANPIDPKLAETTVSGIGLSPLPGSPAIDAGNDALVPAGLSTDAHGAPRIQGARVNIGAVETVLPAQPAATYVVTSLNDSVAADGVITLREALAAANMNTAIGDVPAGSYSAADRIEFAPGLSGTISTSGQPYMIAGSTTLAGPGAQLMALNGGNVGAVLNISAIACAVEVSGVTVTGGRSNASGGGIDAFGANLALHDAAIVSNWARTSGGGVSIVAGSSLLKNLLIQDNRADTPPNEFSGVEGGRAAGLYLRGVKGTIEDVTIAQNIAWDVGGASFDGAMDVRNMIVRGNRAYNSIGGLAIGKGTFTLTNTLIAGNRAASGPGGLYVSQSSATLAHVTIAQNTTTGAGTGVYFSTSTITLNNSIIAQNNASGDLAQTSSTLSGGYNLIGNGTGQTLLVHGANGNLVGTSASPIDPLFVNVAGTDPSQWDLRLQLSSPAINSGSNASVPAGVTADLAGNERIAGGTVDRGAYEFTLLLSTSALAENRPAGSTVGTFATTDSLRTFTYALVTGTGAADNGMFTIVGNELRAASTFDYETRSSYSIRVRGVDTGGRSVEKVFQVNIVDVDEAAPTVASRAINGGAAQRSAVRQISVTFAEPVVLAAGAMVVKLASGAAVPNVAFTVANPSADGMSYLLTFSGAAIVGGSLPDGVYDLVVNAAAVRDLAGNVMVANYTHRFHRLFGDNNGDRRVNMIDYTRLRMTLGRTSGDAGYNAAFDYDGNGLVNVTDLAQFRRRFGKSFIY